MTQTSLACSEAGNTDHGHKNDAPKLCKISSTASNLRILQLQQGSSQTSKFQFGSGPSGRTLSILKLLVTLLLLSLLPCFADGQGVIYQIDPDLLADLEEAVANDDVIVANDDAIVANDDIIVTDIDDIQNDDTPLIVDVRDSSLAAGGAKKGNSQSAYAEDEGGPLYISRQIRLVEYADHIDHDEDVDLTNDWAVEVEGTPSDVDRLAEEMGFTNSGKIRGFRSVYLFHKSDASMATTPNPAHPAGEFRTKREAVNHHQKLLSDRSEVLWSEHQRARRRVKRETKDMYFNDPLWEQQWYLHDTRSSADLPKLDLHVMGAWNKGYTGKGVSVTILDDGVQKDHPDLKQNYDPDASYDLNDNDTDPTPAFNEHNKHGTRCAGEVAMVANNSQCGVGIAYNAKIGGIRMLDGRITDRLESEALQFNIHHVDVFSASWGPNDDGKTVEGPGRLAGAAIENAIKNGRGGKGVIYVWASGNGGTYGDNCDCDGYTDSIYTLSISSASQSGRFPWYGEQCASTIATTYSSGTYTDQKIATTDIVGVCTTKHSGTSASAPLAAGIVALGLEANPNLGWRDVQHISVWTSEPASLLNNTGWVKNGLGLLVNERFGFGLMNAEAFVTAAEKWIQVPEQRICKTIFPDFRPRTFGPGKSGTIRFRTDACKGQTNNIKYLEHVQIVVDIEYSTRGNLEIYLTSPAGTKTQLLTPRSRDESRLGFRSWPFMSVHSWGEDPTGWWELQIYDNVNKRGNDEGAVNNITLIAYGTTEQPSHYKKGRSYNMEYNRIRDRALADQLKYRKTAAVQSHVGEEVFPQKVPNPLIPDQGDSDQGLLASRGLLVRDQFGDLYRLVDLVNDDGGDESLVNIGDGGGDEDDVYGYHSRGFTDEYDSPLTI